MVVELVVKGCRDRRRTRLTVLLFVPVCEISTLFTRRCDLGRTTASITRPGPAYGSGGGALACLLDVIACCRNERRSGAGGVVVVWVSAVAGA